MEISKEDKIRLFDFLGEYERSISSSFGCYNSEDSSLQRFLTECDIFIGSYNKKSRGKAIKHKRYILFEQNTPKGKDNDVVHHLLRHIRNSIAHNHIQKVEKNKFHLEDMSDSNNVTMEGKIDSKVFFALLEKLKNTKIE